MPRGWWAEKRPTPEQRFWSRVEKTDTCWLWNGQKNRLGYGAIGIRGKAVSTHRFSWTLHNGPIPDGMHVLHRCDVRNCVRPDHLFLGTHQDNMADMVRKGRVKCILGADNSFAKLSPHQIEEIRSTYRRYDRKHSSYVLARLYGVHASTIINLISGKTYQNVKEEIASYGI